MVRAGGRRGGARAPPPDLEDARVLDGRRCSRSSSAATAASTATSQAGGATDEELDRARRGSVTEPRVLAVFGPTASGKTAVAEAIADRIPAEPDLRRLHAGLPRPADPHEPVGPPNRARRRSGSSTTRRRWASTQRSRTQPSTTRLPADGRPSSSAEPVSISGRRWSSSISRRHPRPARASAGRPSTNGSGPEAAHALLAERDPEAAARVHANDRRRVVRALELAEAGASLAPTRDGSGASETRHPTLVVGLEVPQGCLRPADRWSERRRCSSPGSRTRSGARWRGPISATARTVHGLNDIARAPAGRGDRRAESRARAGTPPTSASGCGRIPGLVTVPGRSPGWTRSRMRFSKWHAHGNDYLLVQRAEIAGPDRGAGEAVRDYHFGVARRHPRGRLGGRQRGRGRDLESRRLDGRAVRERHAHRRPLARTSQRRRHGADPRRPARGGREDARGAGRRNGHGCGGRAGAGDARRRRRDGRVHACVRRKPARSRPS